MRRVLVGLSVLVPYMLLAVLLLSPRQSAAAPPACDHYGLQTALYPLYQTERADVVMLGDSLTYHAEWSELIGRPGIVRRAIPGDTTTGALRRLDAVLALQPRTVVVLLGTNDLLGARPVSDTWADLQQILERLQAAGARPILVTVPPLAAWHPQAPRYNAAARDLDIRLAAYADGYQLGLVDLAAVIVEHPDWLAADGVHLTAPAYTAWRELLAAFL